MHASAGAGGAAAVNRPVRQQKATGMTRDEILAASSMSLRSRAIRGGHTGSSTVNICRVADLPVRKMLFGRHLTGDLTLRYGKVLHDDLA